MTDKVTDKPFYQTPKDLWRAGGYFSPKTGEPVSLTLAEKAVYMYMGDRISYFIDKMKGEYFETHETIAKAANIERKACGKIVRNFIEQGVMTAVKRKPSKGGQLQWFYTAIDTDLKFWEGSKESPTSLSYARNSNTCGVKPSQVQVFEFDDDEEGSPF